MQARPARPWKGSGYYLANQVWQINAGTGVYAVYRGLPGASDARADPPGNIWWTDSHLSPGSQKLGYIDVSAHTVTFRWTANLVQGVLYRFDREATQLRTTPAGKVSCR